MKRILLLLPLLAAACTSSSVPPPVITNAPPAQQINTAIQATPVGQTIDQGLLDTEFNLDSAIGIGVLPASDPADACVHQVNTQIGIEPTPAGVTPPAPPQSFQPKVTDLISGGSVLYILAAQAKAAVASGGISVPVSCEALIGQFVIRAGTVGLQAIPGAAILPMGKAHK